MKILVFNAGSASQKGSLYEVVDPLPNTAPEPLWKVYIDWSQKTGSAVWQMKGPCGDVEQERERQTRADSIADMLETLWEGPTRVVDGPQNIDAVGHRVVHGGQDYCESTQITPEVKAAIARLAVLAPTHNPANLEGIETTEKLLPSIPQIAVFDTAFHSSLPPVSAIYPGPYAWFEQGIRRYGFHGISHHYCAKRAAQLLNRKLESLRLITCHLGSGCSLAAIQGGQSVDTTMGFTPLEGLMMGSRSGSVDPGILIYLLRQYEQQGIPAHEAVDKLDHLLNHESGLLGVSGLSNDMRRIMAGMQEDNERAQLAFDIYIHRLRAHIGAMLATLGGLDALVFTDGVGEHVPQVRAAACEAFDFLGLKVDPQKNDRACGEDADITADDSKMSVLVVKSQEAWSIACECRRLLPQ